MKKQKKFNYGWRWIFWMTTLYAKSDNPSELIPVIFLFDLILWFMILLITSLYFV